MSCRGLRTAVSRGSAVVRSYSELFGSMAISAALFWALVFSPTWAGAESLVVHLPSTPVENASRRAEALEALAAELTAGVPGLELELKIFRRFQDAEAFLGAEDDVALVFSDAAWVSGLPSVMEAGHRVTIGGLGTYRRLLVAKGPSDSGPPRLPDLRGESLAIVESAGTADAAYLGRAVFGGEIDPSGWFGALRSFPDDSAVVTDLLYGESKAGLVAEYNSLLKAHLEEDFGVVYRSDELSLPVLSVNTALLDGEQRAAVGRVLSGLTAADPALSGLGFEGFASLGADSRQGLDAAPRSAQKRFELPAPASHRLSSPAPPPIEHLPLVLELPLPDPPSAAEELLAGDAGAG